MSYDETRGGDFQIVIDGRGKTWKIPTRQLIEKERLKTLAIRFGSVEAYEQHKQEQLAKLKALSLEKRSLRKVRR